jgi:POT family proton-dependent oligopeptide transporter
MGVEGDGNPHGPAINIFWLALAFIIVGSGFLKANISVIVGKLYPRTDVRRDSAYTIFYVGVNLGAALGGIIAGYLGETYGWSYGFGAAGFCMLLGLGMFIWGKPYLQGQGETPNAAVLAKKMGGLSFENWLYVLGVAAVGVIWMLIQYQALIGSLLLIAGLSMIGYILWIATTTLTREERNRIIAVILFTLISVLFWALFEQAGSSLNLYTDRYVDRAGVKASLFQSINPIYIIVFGPIFAVLWTWLGKRGWEPSTPAKFGLALLQLGFAFLVLVWGARAAGAGATPVLFIFLVYLFQTTGELCISPVGLSAMNRLAPAHMASLIMGAWFLASSAGDFAAGLIAVATGSPGKDAGKAMYLNVYNTGGWVAIGVGVFVLLVAPLIKRLMHLDTLKDDAI